MNKNIWKEIGLNEDNYNVIENEYKRVFECKLLSKINLASYEKEIDDSDFGFGKLEVDIKIKSGLKEFLELNHFYVLNNFQIDKLEKNEIEILINGSEEQKSDLIAKTYKEVIWNNYHNGEYLQEPYKINYLYSNGNNGYAYNNELVIIIYYGKNIKEYGSKEKYLDNFIEKRIFLRDISSRISDEVKQKLDISCKVLYEKII